MPRFYVEYEGEWNIFSTVTDDFLFDEFVCLDALKARLLYERYKELEKDMASLLTDKPTVNVMSYEEAIERQVKNIINEPQTDDIGNCNICKYVGLEHRCNQCVNGSQFYKVEDEPQTFKGLSYDDDGTLDVDDEPQTEAWHDDCNTCRWHDGACTIPCCDYEPKTEPQTERAETMSCQECKWWFTDSLKHGGYCQSLLYNHECRYEPEVDCSWK